MTRLDISQQLKFEPDAFDTDMLVTIIKTGFRYGSASSYSIWSYLKDEAILTGDLNKFMAYKNVNKRIVKLLNHGLISQINTGKTNVHGRKDYKLTDIGLTYLVPYFLTHPKDVKTLVYYMNNHKIDKNNFGRLLRKGHALAVEALTSYEKYSESLDPDESLIELTEEVKQRLKSEKPKGVSYEEYIRRLALAYVQSRATTTTTNDDLQRKRGKIIRVGKPESL